MFEEQYRWILKLLAKMMGVWILPVLSTRCFHQWGGSKMMLRELQAWIKPGDFVYKTDVYSYYASINHVILIQQIKAINWPRHHLETVIAYCQRTILRIGASLHCTSGIPKGGSLSPVLGALYLTPLDHAMERWMARGDCFYARFQDDIILVSRKRHVLKRMRKEMYQVLRKLRLILRPEKTFVGRSQKGFDLNAKQRYAQGGNKSLVEYLNRWRTWIHAGLPFKINRVDDVINSIIDLVVETTSSNDAPKQSRVWFSRSQLTDSYHKYLTRLNPPIACSVKEEIINKKKGKSSCLIKLCTASSAITCSQSS